jgi:cystathionine beta-lyase
MYNFDEVHNRIGTGSIKWNKQRSFGVKDRLLPFWIADTDFASLPEILDAIKERCNHPIIGYSDDCDDSCKEAVMGWYKRRHNWEVDKDALLLGGGVVTAIRFTLQAITDPNDKVLVFTPVYDPFFAVTGNTNRKLVKSQLVLKDGKYKMDFDNVEQSFKAGVKAIILCNPQNPVGRVWSYEELSQLADLCKKYSIYVLADEIHGDIGLYGNKYTPMGKFKQIHDRLVVFTAISKTFNMAGLISSCMMIPNPELKEKVDESLSEAWLFGPNAIAYSAITAAYTYGDQWVDEQNDYLSENATYVTEYFKKHMPDIGVAEIEGTFLMWLDFNCLGLTSEELTNLMAENYKLAISNGEHYGDQCEGFMRFNIGCARSTLEKGVTTIHKLYKDIKK